MTVYVITSGSNDNDPPSCYGVYATLNGAKAAIRAWAEDQWEGDDLVKYWEEFKTDDGICTEYESLEISKEEVKS